MEYIRESPYLQYFLVYEGYKDELPFESNMMVHFRKRLSVNILKGINALIIENNKFDDDEGKGAGEGDTREPENKGTLIVDATCVPEDMRFPHDVMLLDEAILKTVRSTWYSW